VHVQATTAVIVATEQELSGHMMLLIRNMPGHIMQLIRNMPDHIMQMLNQMKCLSNCNSSFL
jgi:hypothetical protein